jgi:tetratricopeptide (TPR) repeat protein
MLSLREGRAQAALLRVLLLLGVLSAALVAVTQWRLEHIRTARPAEEFRYLPKGDHLKVAALGYDQLVADLLWLKTIQVMGEKGREAQDAEWLYQAFDAITTLDPKFDYVYQLGGIFLSVLSGRADLAVQLLSKGTQNNPGIWQLHFYLGFDQFYYFGRFKEAADAIARAAALPGRPDWVPMLATRLYAQAEEPEFAIEFLDRMYQVSKDEKVREELLARRKELVVERDLNILNRTVREFQERSRRPPDDLRELVTAGLLHGLPEEPFGGRYYYDSSDGQVKSSIHKERLRVDIPERRLGAPTHTE